MEDDNCIDGTAGDGVICGYASVFEVVDKNSECVVKGAFQKAIENFRRGIKPKLLWQHDVSTPIGIVDEIFEDDHGLFVRAHLMMDIPKGEEAYRLLKNRVIDGFSIGYRVKRREKTRECTRLTEIDLLEISIVTFPACEAALISDVKMEKIQVKNFTEGKNKEINMNNNLNCEKMAMKNDALPMGNYGINRETSDFCDFVRAGVEYRGRKSLNMSDGEHGGFLVPDEIAEKVNKRLKYLSPMRALAKVIKISSNSVDILTDTKSFDAGWSGSDEEERLETDTPELRKIKIPVWEIYARPKATQALLDDAQIDIESWIVNKIAEKFAALENHAFVNGNGNQQPKGFLAYDSEAQEVRDFGVLQHFNTGANGSFRNDETALTVLIDMACSLKPIYVKNAKWIMSRSALAVVRKIKNSDGQLIWQASLSEATPSTLLGYPVILDDDMPALSNESATTSIAFGDFRAGYQIVDRQELNLLRDPYSAKPFVEFYATKRTGGGVVDFDAIKLLKFAE